jgi:hypothetical protein
MAGDVSRGGDFSEIINRRDFWRTVHRACQGYVSDWAVSASGTAMQDYPTPAQGCTLEIILGTITK